MDTDIIICGFQGTWALSSFGPKEHVGVHLKCFDGPDRKWHSSLLLTFHWLELSHMAILSHKGVWEM